MRPNFRRWGSTPRRSDPSHLDGPQVGGSQTGHHPEQGALSGTARAEHSYYLAVIDDEIDPVEDRLPVEDHRDRVDVEHQKPPSPPGRARSIESATTTVITMRTTLSAIAREKVSSGAGKEPIDGRRDGRPIGPDNELRRPELAERDHKGEGGADQPSPSHHG